MKTVIATESRALVSLSSDEIMALANSMNEVLHNSSIDERDCLSRIGIEYLDLQELHRSLLDMMRAAKSSESEVFDVWRDGESVQIRAMSVFGDPADLGLDEVSGKIRPLLEEPEEAYQAGTSNGG